MANGTQQKPDLNPGQQHSNDLFDHFENQYKNPTGSSVGEDANIDRAKAATDSPLSKDLNKAESGASLYKEPPKDVADAEANANAPDDNQTGRSKGKRRGMLGVVAGGGIIGALVSLALLLPMKLIGVMDDIVDKAGARVEQVVKKRVDRYMIDKVVFRGKSATGADLLKAGNPIGDALKNEGYTVERGDNSVKISKNGSSVGEFKNAQELQDFLDKDVGKDLRVVFDGIGEHEWQFYQRANVVSYLRAAWNAKFGDRNQKADESDADYEKSVNQNIEKQVGTAEATDAVEAIDCLSSAGDNCANANGDKVNTDPNGNKAGGGDELKGTVNQAVTDAVNDVGATTGDAASKTIADRVSASIFSQGGGKLLPAIGQIDFIVRAIKTITNTAKNGTLQKLHALWMKRGYIALFATMAGYADMTKAGNLGIATTGMVADKFNGLEGTQSWNFINSGTLDGQGLSGLQRIDESLGSPTWLKNAATVFEYATFPVTLWYNTISKAIDFLGQISADALSKIPGVNTAMAAIGKIGSKLMVDFLSMVGMSIDPQTVGPLLHLMTFAGGVSAFDEQGKNMGLRKLSHKEASTIDSQIRQERQTEMADASFTDRIFNLNNSSSLASAFVGGSALSTDSNPLTAVAFTGINLLAKAPTNVANILTSNAMAASDAIPEDIAGQDPYGAFSTDVSVPFTANTANCPAMPTDGSVFNTCLVDKHIETGINCSAINTDCPEIQTPGSADTAAAAPTTVASGTATQLATQILASKNITYEPDANGVPDGAHTDLMRTAAGEATSCGGKPVSLDPALLAAILTAAQKYTFRINALTSDHACTDNSHAIGKGVDVGWVNGKPITPDTVKQDATLQVYRQFVIDMSRGMPGGGHINQKNCIGVQPLLNNVKMIWDDLCTHIHIDTVPHD